MIRLRHPSMLVVLAGSIALGTGPVATAAETKPVRCLKTELDLPGPMNRVRAWNARLITTTGLRRSPRLSTRPFKRLSPLTTHGDTSVLLVTGRACDAKNRVWLRVLVPMRPNNTNAWILRDHVIVERNPYRVLIDQRTRRLTLFRAGRRVFRVPVAVGTPSTPTPSGRFALAEIVATNQPGHFLGPVVLPTTGFSEVLNEYAGGNGRFALHGTSLPHLIGTRASHGCIRLHNQNVLRLARYVRAGTPLVITPP